MFNPFKTKLWKLFTTTQYTYEKEVISAVVVSNRHFKTKHKAAQHGYMFTMYAYAALVFIVTVISLGMLAFSRDTQNTYSTAFSTVEVIVFAVLLADTFLRWYSSEVRIRRGNLSYFMWPFTFNGLILLASLLPSLYLIDLWTGKNIPFFERMEDLKFLRIFRIILLANLIPGLSLFKRALSKEKRTLYIVFGIVITTMVLFALVIFNVETSDEAVKQFATDKGIATDGLSRIEIEKLLAAQHLHIPIHNFLDAMYFSTVSLTTIGFGDIVPITHMGKIITIIMSIAGIAVLATPAGVITSGFIQEIKEAKKVKDEKKAAKQQKA